MKIAIHHTKGSFSERWIKYCDEQNIAYKLVNCFDSNIVQQLEDCDALMWHHSHDSFRDGLVAHPLLFSLQFSGKKIFPDFNTAWHFDDKIAQKYLFESLNIPYINTYVFYNKEEALQWFEKTTYPKVFKLRGGAGSSNVKLIRNENQAKKIVNKAFGSGFKAFDGIDYFKDTFKKYRIGKESKLNLLKAFAHIFISTAYGKMKGNEKGYVYVQDFLPNKDSDIRIVVIAEKAYGIKRLVRQNDFRASGSGKILYEAENIPLPLVKIAFDAAEKLKSQCAAFDFIYNEQGIPLIVEVSYGFSIKGYDTFVGHWDKQLNYYPGLFNPYGWMVENLIHQK
jgi:glutathione synthase/RimK-type ligase-like ATP-grasp enzyme